MKETLKKMINGAKITGKKAIDFTKKNPVAIAVTGLAVGVGACSIMKHEQNKKVTSAYQRGWNDGVDNGFFSTASSIKNYLSGRDNIPFKDVSKELDENVGYATYKIKK